MKYFLKRYAFLVIAQTACLALGFWLEHSFIVSLDDADKQKNNVTESVDHAGTDASGENSAINSSLGNVKAQSTSSMAVKGIALLWIAAIQATVAYLVLTRDQEEVVRKHQQVEKVSLQQYNELLRTRDAVIFGLAKLAESRDTDTGNHLERIAIYSTRLASALCYEPCYRDQVTPTFIKLIGINSALHDIGKVGIRDAVLLKPGRLERQERLMIQLHAAIGGNCIREIESRLGRSNFLKMAREIAFCHHEHWDGTGYPKGLAGEEIPLAARIVAIADVYDALSSKRIYKEAYPHKKCVEIIREGAGKHFDPVLVKVFLKLEAEFHDIARSCRDAVEELNAEEGDDDETGELAAVAEMSLDGKFFELEAMLDECSEDFHDAAESAANAEAAARPNCDSLQRAEGTNPESDLSKIEREPEHVS